MMVNLNAERSLSGRLRYVFEDDTEMSIGGHGPSLTKRVDDEGNSNSESESDDEPDILLGADGVFALHAKVSLSACGGGQLREVYLCG